MALELDFSCLPSLPLTQREQLPQCPAIYVAIDDQDRVLYVGQALNLLERWKGHHRFEQLTHIHKKTPVRLVWIDCSDRPEALTTLEAELIAHHQPLLNKTQVPAKRIVPAEVALQESLKKAANYLFILGWCPAQPSQPATIHLRYVGFTRDVHILKRIFKASNRKPTGLRWVEVVRRKDAPFWEAKCNGVKLTVGFFWQNDNPVPRDGAHLKIMAGVELFALTDAQLSEVCLKIPTILQSLPNLQPYDEDLIPLLWNRLQ